MDVAFVEATRLFSQALGCGGLLHECGVLQALAGVEAARITRSPSRRRVRA